jgi:uncharacterized protein YukE
MDTDSLDLINFSLEEKTKQLEELYKELDMKLEELDGTDQTWKGKAQETFYNHYIGVSAHFPDVVDQFNSYVLFLAETIENYNNRNKDISEDIDKNENNLDVN